jgi:segregation and condensation protein A
MPVNVQLDIYEGPLDLLLHLIKKNEIDVADIPIAIITEQYLSTLELMESLNLDVAGEFLVMAATLVHVKSRMLLPPEEGEEEEDEEGDPREELFRKLIEYQRYKEAGQDLEMREVLNRDVFTRRSEEAQEGDAVQFEQVTVFDLLSAFQKVLKRFPEERDHTVTLERISVREKMSLLLDRLRGSSKWVFQSLFEEAVSRMEVIVTFLALLELIKMRAVRVVQEERMGPIHIESAAPLEEVREKVATEDVEKR